MKFLSRKPVLSVTASVGLAFAVLAPPAGAANEFDKYALEEVGVALSSKQAGAHADLSTFFKLSRDGSQQPYAQTRDLEVALPPGVIGNPQGIPRCTVQQLGNAPQTSE